VVAGAVIGQGEADGFGRCRHCCIH
jgi:hypothetical protein